MHTWYIYFSIKIKFYRNRGILEESLANFLISFAFHF